MVHLGGLGPTPEQVSHTTENGNEDVPLRTGSGEYGVGVDVGGSVHANVGWVSVCLQVRVGV